MNITQIFSFMSIAAKLVLSELTVKTTTYNRQLLLTYLIMYIYTLDYKIKSLT